MTIDDDGVSPIVGIILLTAVTVALVSLAAVFVFDVGQSSNAGIGTATVTAEYESESSIDVQLLKQGSSERVIVRSALGTEYILNSTGDSVTLLNQESNQTPLVLGEKNGERTVLREVPPQSFSPDIIVSKNPENGQYETIQQALDSSQDGDIIVLKQDTYYENIDVSTPNVTLVGETGTVIADNSSDSSVINVQTDGVRISNINVNANSTQGDSAAEYGIKTNNLLELSRISTTNANTSDTEGTIETVSDVSLVDTTKVDATSRLGIIPKTPQSEWVNTYNSSSGRDDFVKGVAVDSTGDVVVAGYYYNGNTYDWRIVKYNKSGVEQWTNIYNSNSQEFVTDVTVDSNNNAIVSGNTNKNGDYDWRVSKYSPSGDRKWVSLYDGKDGNDGAKSVSVDSNDNIIVSGNTYINGTYDWRVAKYNQNGDKQWSQRYDGGNTDGATGTAVMDNNDVVVSGRTNDGTTYNWRITKYSSSGNPKFNITYDSGNGDDKAKSVAVDANNNIVVAGWAFNGADQDWRVAKYATNGTHLWNTTYDSGNGDDKAKSVATDKNNNIAVFGFKDNSADKDWRLVILNKNGTQKHLETYDSENGNDYGRTVAVGRDVFITAGRYANGNSANWRIEKHSE